MKTTVVETGVAETDAAVEEEAGTGGAAVIVLVVDAVEAEVCFCFYLQMIISFFPLLSCLILDSSNLLLFFLIGRRSFRRSFRRNDFCRFGRISVDRNGRLRCFDSATGMTLLSEKPVVTTTTTSDDVDEYQYVMIDEKPPQDTNDRAIDDEDEDSGDDEDYDSWDEDEDEDDSSDSPDTEEW